MTGINAIIYLLSSIPPCVSVQYESCHDDTYTYVRWYLVDRWGRRSILMSGAVVVGSQFCYRETVLLASFSDGDRIDGYGVLDVDRHPTDA